ncbi:MAG TPA: hypothetical protein VGJ78_14130 [Vicinamibacterales bacterium]|jgi:hypothetical protein
MVVRVVAVALACVMTGAPVATTACQAACAEHEQAPATTNEHHSCHHMAAADGVAVTAGSHLCGHSDDGSNAIDQALQTLGAPGVAVVPFSVLPPVDPAFYTHITRVEQSPPGILTLTTQLRV